MNNKTADRLFKYRKANGLSQEELAEKIGVSRQAVSKWERGESSPDTDNLITLAGLYKISIDELINGDSIPEKAENADVSSQTEKKYDRNQNSYESGSSETSDNTYVSFKNGIHVRDNKDNVDIDFSGIHVETQKGESVHVSPHGIHVQGIDNDHIFKRGKKENLFHALIPICVITAYLIIGFTFEKGWALGWLLIFIIPIVESLITAIKTKRSDAFAYPVLVAAIYLTVGMLEQIWHPTWLMFLTIPIYYIISDFFKPDKNKINNDEK